MNKKLNHNAIKSKNNTRFDIKLPQNYDKRKPIFSFRHMDHRGKNCITNCDKPSRASMIKTLLQLSQLTWNQILSAPKESHGKENIPINQFKVTLPDIITPDVKSLIVFRFSKSDRMAGLRHNDIYDILVAGSDLYHH